MQNIFKVYINIYKNIYKQNIYKIYELFHYHYLLFIIICITIQNNYNFIYL